ncbi:MAG: sodium/proline symporter PutP [Ruminococcaceae bacterium]|nr:sodium/proline symporter PutP [Oscillospiraceae bacterium]
MDIFAFVLYFVAMIAIGVIFFVKSKGVTEKDYFLGGRAMGPWVTAMSAQASDMSAWLLMGLPGSILAFGFGQAWIGIGLAIGTAANWILVAKRLRKFSKASGDAITLPQYLSNRFASKSHAVSIICAVVFLVCFTIYVASAFVAGSDVFVTLVPGLSKTTAMIIFAAIVLAYTFLGGFKAVCWTDFFQGLLMIAALLIVPIVVGFTRELEPAALTTVYEGPNGEQFAFVANFFNASWKDIVSGLGWGLGYFGMPHIIVRFMAIEKPSMVKKSATVAIIWVVLSLAATIVIAYLGRMFIDNNGVDLSKELLANGQQSLIFVQLAKQVFPAFIAGLLLAAIIAASMSTADSQLLVAASSFSSDLYKPIIRKQASNKEMLWVSRIVVLVIAVIAFFIASSKGKAAQAIMDLVSNAWGIFGAAFGPAVLFSLFWKRFTYKGAVAGIVVGALVDMLWLWLPVSGGLTLTALTGIYEIIPGFVIGAVAAVVVTLLDKAPSKEVEEIFARATDNSIDD